MIKTVEFIFNVSIGLGLAIPLLDTLMGVLGSFIDVDFDIGGHHVGDVFDLGGEGSADAGNAIPLNIMCLCFGLVVFGALGRLTVGLMVNALAVIACFIGLIVISTGAYALLYKFVVGPLKKSYPKAIGYWDLLGSKGKLTLRISHNSPGTVSLKDSTGAMISYMASARAAVMKRWDGEIPQGADVIVVDIDTSKKMAFVKPLDTFDNQRLKQK